jgi:hypothetical protein
VARKPAGKMRMNIAGDNHQNASGIHEWESGTINGLNSGLSTWLPSDSIAMVWVPALRPYSSKIQKSASMKPRQVA